MGSYSQVMYLLANTVVLILLCLTLNVDQGQTQYQGQSVTLSPRNQDIKERLNLTSGCSANTTKITNPWCIFDVEITVTFKDPNTTLDHTVKMDAMIGTSGSVITTAGWAVHTQTQSGENHACDPLDVKPPQPWVALVERGVCRFYRKLMNSALLHNATAVVIYNNEFQSNLIRMQHNVSDVVSVFISRENGTYLANLVDNGVKVWLDINITNPKFKFSFHPNSVPNLNPIPQKAPPTSSMPVIIGVVVVVIVVLMTIVGVLVAKKSGKLWWMQNRVQGVFGFQQFS